MADKKITELTELTEIADEDILPIVDDPGGSPTTKKITKKNLIASFDGWTPTNDTWVYASASTFTIAGVNRTAFFTPGTRLKFTQTSVKYAVVVSSSFASDTTVTIAVNTNYTIADAAITSPYYSYEGCPQGYPTFFNYNPTLSNLTEGDGSETAFFSVNKGVVNVFYRLIFGSTSAVAGNVSISYPINPHSYTRGPIGFAYFDDDNGSSYVGTINHATGSTFSPKAINAAGTYIIIANLSSTVPMTWATSDMLTCTASYIMYDGV